MAERNKFSLKQVMKPLLKSCSSNPHLCHVLFSFACLCHPVFGLYFLSFFWGGFEDNEKLCWKSWEDLCNQKNMGGMGFRDFEGFNLALLTKQCWHIITSSSYLVANCLQAKYFSSGNFLCISLGHRSSYLLWGLLEGRNLLYLLLQYRIGNDISTKILQDK